MREEAEPVEAVADMLDRLLRIEALRFICTSLPDLSTLDSATAEKEADREMSEREKSEELRGELVSCCLDL